MFELWFANSFVRLILVILDMTVCLVLFAFCWWVWLWVNLFVYMLVGCLFTVFVFVSDLVMVVIVLI